MLDDADIERFVEDGLVAVRGAFPREVAQAAVARLTPLLDPASTAPVQRVHGSIDPLIVGAANTPALVEAFDQLVGPGRWLPKRGLGTFPVRFPSEDDPGDAGWHVDGGYEPAGQQGLDFMTFARHVVPATDHLPVALATGRAGDVYLCHPFLVHAASWPHRGSGAPVDGAAGARSGTELRRQRTGMPMIVDTPVRPTP